MTTNEIEKIIISDLLQTDGQACRIDNTEFNNTRYRRIHTEIEKNTPWAEIPDKVNMDIVDFVELMNYSPTKANAQEYCRLLINENRKNTLHGYLNKWQNGDITIEQVEEDLKTLKESMPSNEISIDEIINTLIKRIDNPLSTLPLPLPTLNNSGGLIQGNLMTLAGRTGAGKSALALQIAKYVSREKKVVYISLEMLPEEMFARLIASESDLEYADIIKGTTSKNKLVQISERCKKFNISFTEKGRNINEISDTLAVGKPNLLIIDSVNLVKGTGETERIKMLNTTREIKQMALSSKIPILMIAQLNRDAEEKPIPRLSDLKESGSIEEDSDIVFALSEIKSKKMLNAAQDQIGLKIMSEEIFGDITRRKNRAVFGAILKNRSGKRLVFPIEFHTKKYTLKEVDVLETDIPSEDEVPF